jgi:hypothetical protein
MPFCEQLNDNLVALRQQFATWFTLFGHELRSWAHAIKLRSNSEGQPQIRVPLGFVPSNSARVPKLAVFVKKLFSFSLSFVCSLIVMLYLDRRWMSCGMLCRVVW